MAFMARHPCLGCLARRTAALCRNPAGSPLSSSSASTFASTSFAPTSTSPVLVHVRGKKTGRRGDNGVVVRLLEDIPQFGRKDSILRADRGRMRNLWYPKRMAEYMTAARFADAGLDPAEALVERDPLFAVQTEAMAEDEHPEDDAAAAGLFRAARPRPTLRLRTVDADRAAELLQALLPPQLVFSRQANPDAGAGAGAIFGSVSADDVAAAVREALRGDPEAALIRVEGRDVRFIGAVEAETAEAAVIPDSAPSDADHRVRALGRWEVEIAVRGAAAVRKTIQVVAQE